MEAVANNHLVIISITIEKWNQFESQQAEILKRLDDIKASCAARTTFAAPYITAIEFMNAVNISRSYFDSLVARNKIKTIKKFLQST